jgi:hypothetical protein
VSAFGQQQKLIQIITEQVIFNARKHIRFAINVDLCWRSLLVGTSCQSASRSLLSMNKGWLKRRNESHRNDGDQGGSLLHGTPKRSSRASKRPDDARGQSSNSLRAESASKQVSVPIDRLYHLNAIR